jgi:hypothetical protein
MKFDPATGMMKCPFCGCTAPVPAAGAAEKLPRHLLEECLATAHQGQLQPLTPAALEVHCEGCGGSVTFHPPEVAGSCPFCGMAIVAEPKAADPLLAPDAVLPAKVSQERAQAEVRQWLSTRWFAPNALKRMARQEAIHGVYLPFWSYDADTSSDYVGERGEHYWETEYYTETDDQGHTVQRSRQVQRTNWYPAAGHVAQSFADILIAASRSVEEKKLNALQPWGLEALCRYEPAYLAGFKAQRYQVELSNGFEEAKGVMAPAIERSVCGDIGGDEQRVLSVDTRYANVTFQHLLLPVWIGAFRFQSKVYQVVVNASTGEVQGERPYSAWKISLLVLAIALIVALLVLFGGQR